MGRSSLWAKVSWVQPEEGTGKRSQAKGVETGDKDVQGSREEDDQKVRGAEYGISHRESEKLYSGLEGLLWFGPDPKEVQGTG